MNTVFVESMATVAKEVGQEIVKQAPKYGAKLVLGVPCEVGIYFASKKIIKELNKAVQKGQVTAEA